MDISVQDLTSVDKEVTLKAKREDLQEDFDKAYKKVRNQIALPGFRPGKVPMQLIKKRFGNDIELEEINKYVQRIFEKDIAPEYDPVGETEMTDLQWEDDELEVTFKIGQKPEFELADIESLTVKKMVHDVTDEEVEEEIERSLEREGNWEEVDEEIEENSKVIADVSSIDEDGNEIEGEKDLDQEIDLRQDGAKEFKKELTGKKPGDTVDMELTDGEETDRFRVEVKKVKKLHKAELSEEFIKSQSNGEASNKDEFHSYIKSRMQDYYDQTSDDLFKNEVVDVLVSNHDFAIPETFIRQIQNSYIEQLKQQYGDQLPETFDEEEYKSGMAERAVRDGRWYFINQKLQDTFEDIEIKPEDIDEFLSMQAAQYGMPVDQLKQHYANNPNMLEQLRSSIREDKVFEKLQDVVTIEEVGKEEYREYQQSKSENND